MKEEICIEIEHWKQGRLKLSKNKSLENVVPGDIVMLCRENKLMNEFIKLGARQDYQKKYQEVAYNPVRKISGAVCGPTSSAE